MVFPSAFDGRSDRSHLRTPVWDTISAFYTRNYPKNLHFFRKKNGPSVRKAFVIPPYKMKNEANEEVSV